MEFAIERISDCIEELKPITERHWQEVAFYKNKMALDVDWGTYRVLEDQGMIHMVTARSGGMLVGYWMGFLFPNPFYRSTPTAHTSVYYLEAPFRKGTVGIRLFKFVEKSLKAKGIKLIITSTKIAHDVGRMFEFLGWDEVERVYSKWIGA